MFLYVFADFGAPLNYQVLPLGLAYNQFPNGTLLISSVDKASKGAYTCTAQNGIRSAISKTINVTVNGMYILLYLILYASVLDNAPTQSGSWVRYPKETGILLLHD